MIKPKPHYCIICKKEIFIRSSFERSTKLTCGSSECALEFIKFHPEKARKVHDKMVKKDLKEIKERTLDRKYYLKLAQIAFNAYIRHRDRDKPCISCGTTKPIQYCAGHFYAVGSFPNLRFEELNVHKQCNQYCNMKLSGNLTAYRGGLIERIGQEKFDVLEAMKRTEKHYSIDDLKEIIKYYRNKIKEK